jgi:hypothetical protein
VGAPALLLIAVKGASGERGGKLTATTAVMCLLRARRPVPL